MEKFRSLFVVLNLVNGLMASAVQLHCHLFSRAVEIEHESSDGMLAAELLASEASISKDLPQPVLGVGVVLPEAAGVLGGLGRHRHSAPPLTPALSPWPGRGRLEG